MIEQKFSIEQVDTSTNSQNVEWKRRFLVTFHKILTSKQIKVSVNGTNGYKQVLENMEQ